jgi:tetratricopeptide (TPR) repeat protein
MVEQLNGLRRDLDTRIEVIRDLLSRGLVEPAWNEATAVSRAAGLSSQQRATLLTLSAELQLLKGKANDADASLARLKTEHPEAAKDLRATMLAAVTRLETHPTDATAMQDCMAIVKDQADTPEAAIAELAILRNQLASDPQALEPLVTWLKAHPSGPWSALARERSVKGIGALLGEQPGAAIESDSEPVASDTQAINIFAMLYPLIRGTDTGLALLRDTVLPQIEKRYVDRKAFDAADATLAELKKAPLTPESARVVAAAEKRWAERRAAAELDTVLLTAQPEALAAWIGAHPDHPRVEEARRRLLAACFQATMNAGVPDEQSPLAEPVSAAIALTGEIIADIEKPEDAVKVTRQTLDFLTSHYAQRGSLDAAIAGANALLKLELPRAGRLAALQALIDFQTKLAIRDLTRQANAGSLVAGPLPGGVKQVISACQKLREEFPAENGWLLQATLAQQVHALSGQTPWPTRIAEPKPPLDWAFVIALPVVEQGDLGTEKTARDVIQKVVQECSAIQQQTQQPSAIGIASGLQAKLLAATDSADATWPATVLQYAQLLRADAAATFQRNAKSGAATANDALNEPAKTAVTALQNLVQAQPAQATPAMAELEALLQPWRQSQRLSVVEQGFELLAANLPPQSQREVRLRLARLWLTQVKQRDARLVAAGVQPAAALDPLLQKALVTCYDLRRETPENSPLLAEIKALRSEILGHYQGLDYEDVVATAIQVKGAPPVPDADAEAELDLARQQLRLARQEMQRTLKEHNGVERLAVTPAFQQALASLQQIIQARPTHPLTQSAIADVLGVAQGFSAYQRYDLAVSVYRDAEKAWLEIEPLTVRVQNQPLATERAALATATALKQAAEKALQESRKEQGSDAKPPQQLSPEYAAAIDAYVHNVNDYQDGPLVANSLAGIQQIAVSYAELGSWDVAGTVYDGLLKLELPLRVPERLVFAKAVCMVGKVMPEHGVQLLKAMSQDNSRWENESREMLAMSGYDYARGTLDIGGGMASGGFAGRFERPEDTSAPPASGPGARPQPAGEVAQPLIAGDSGAQAAGQSQPKPDANMPAPTDSLSLGVNQDPAAAQREATLLAAVQRQEAMIANRVAQLRDRQIAFRQTAVQSAQQVSLTVLSDAEVARQATAIEAAYAALHAITQEYPHTSTSGQARSEIMVLIAHWREINRWKRAADLARKFLGDHPQDPSYVGIRTEIARDLLAWASAGVDGDQSKQQTLETLNDRFTAARDELAAIVADFPDNPSVRQQAEWDIATSFLTQAKVVASLSPTLARGQFVRSAEELLKVAETYHDHPNINAVPQLLWQISQELTGRGFYDEAITVWTGIAVHYPLDPLARQATMQTAQTYQSQLGLPLRAVETYVELYFATGGTDASIQNTVYQIATDLKAKKRWIEALHVLETFTNAFPTHPQAGQALTAIGDIHQTNEAWEDAITAYERVIDEYAGSEWNKQARWAIAECKINLSQWDAAAAAYRKFAQDYGEDARVAEANRRIDVLKNLARYQRVADEENQPKAFDAQYQIGEIVNSQLSNRVKAIIEFRKVADDYPKEHLADDALYQVGSLNYQLGDTAAAREALLAVAEQYPNSPLADDALFLVGRSFEKEAEKYSAVTRSKSEEIAQVEAQKQAYQLSQNARRLNRARGQEILSDLKKAGKLAEADEEVANYAARNKAYEQAAVEVIANQARQQAETLTAQQMADRQDKINAALRKAVDVYRKAAALVSGDKSDDALLRMADIYDQQLKDEEEALAVWQAIVKQFGGTPVAEDSSWKIAQYYERKNQHDKAINAYEQFLRSYRNSGRAGDAMIGIAEQFERLDKWVDAMDWYTSYVNKYPEGPQVARAKEQITWIKTYRL